MDTRAVILGFYARQDGGKGGSPKKTSDNGQAVNAGGLQPPGFKSAP
jgi:hypothetical protein